ncbi:hypothetical protein HDU86_002813 [Geranomyces michiganensis]|nr:hypothetical protein HDU86_002813 [Geranomyces michiganensis]
MALASVDVRAVANDLASRINALRTAATASSGSGLSSARPATPPRILVCIAGIPGSGKTTLAETLVGILNAEQLQQAIAMPMDGFHLSKAQLSASADPVMYHARRGAPFTFDATALLILLRRVRYDSPHKTVFAPAFAHATGDPVADAIGIAPHHRIVVVEGLYLLADVEPWSNIRPLCDLCYWLDVDVATARERVVKRHVDAGLASTRAEAEKRWELNDQLNAAWVLEHSWIYCVLAVVHCFATWNLLSASGVNYVGTHDDGFALDLTGLTPPPNVNFSRLLAARRLVAQGGESLRDDSVNAAREYIAATDAALAWGPPPPPPSQQPLVPPILHQVLVGMPAAAPQKWIDAANACTAIHPGWKIMTWNDAAAEAFIQREHPWFYDTWMGYRFNIQKADSLRYLLLYTYGGVYLDMDIQCRRSLDPLRRFPFLAIAAHPVGVSNSFIMAAPKTEFLLRLVQNLQLFNRYFFSAYPTVMISTGCMYVSVQHSLYARRSEELKVIGGLHNRINGAVTTPLFKHLGSSSWHGDDARLFVKLGQWLKKVPVFGTGSNTGKDAEVVDAGGAAETSSLSLSSPPPPPPPAAAAAAPAPPPPPPPPRLLRPVDDVPLLPFFALMAAVIGCLASFQLLYRFRQRHQRGRAPPLSSRRSKPCCVRQGGGPGGCKHDLYDAESGGTAISSFQDEDKGGRKALKY